MVEKKELSRLQSALSGAVIGARLYEKLEKDSKDSLLSDKFAAYNSAYEEYAEELTAQMSSLGGNPVISGGTAGRMASISYALRGFKRRSPLSMLESAHKGEAKSIEKSARLYKRCQSHESRRLLERNICEAQCRMDTLANLILDYRLHQNSFL